MGNALEWPGPTSPSAPGPSEIVGSGQAVREAVKIGQGSRVPILYGRAKIGYDIVYLNTASSAAIVAADAEHYLTAVGVLSEGPIHDVTKYVMPDGTEFDLDDWRITGAEAPLLTCFFVKNGMPPPNVQVSAASALGSTWGYRIAYTYSGAMPFGATPEVTVNGASTPDNTISWDIPFDANGYPLVAAVTVFRETSPDEGTYPLGCIGRVSYLSGSTLPLTRLQNPVTNSLEDSGQALIDTWVPIDPAPCSLMPGTAFVVMSWWRNNTFARKVEFPRFIAEGLLVPDPRAPTSATVTTGDATVAVASTAGLLVGTPLYGTGIPADTEILSITDATHFEMTSDATATGTEIFIPAYSTNPVLHVLNQKLSQRYGDGVLWEDVDLVDLSAAADYAEGTVNTPDPVTGPGTRTRYVSGVFLRELRQSDEWQATLSLHAGLRWRFFAGKWSCTIDQATTPKTALTEDDIIGSPVLERELGAGKGDVPNRVVVEWTDSSADGGWRVRTVQAQTEEVEQGGEVREGPSYPMHGCQNEHEADQIAWRILNSLSLDGTIVCRVMPRRRDLSRGDVVPIVYSKLGLASHLFRIEGFDRDDADGSYLLSGTEYSDDIVDERGVAVMGLCANLVDEPFSDDFENTAALDMIASTGGTQETAQQVTAKKPGFEYTLPQFASGYEKIIAYWFVGETGTAKTWDELVTGHAAGTAGYGRQELAPAGIAAWPYLWDPDPTVGSYVTAVSSGPVSELITIDRVFGSDGVTVVSSTTTTDLTAMTVRWKLVSSAGEVSSATGYVYHQATDESTVVTTGLGTVPPIPVIHVTPGDTLDFAPSIHFDVPDSDFATYLEAAYSGTGDCTVTGDDGESSWASPFSGTIVLDTGASGRRFKGLYYKAASVNGSETTDIVVAFSSNGSSWTTVSGFAARVAAQFHNLGGANLLDDNTPNYATWTDPGAAYRYWRITNGSGAAKIRETSGGTLHSLSGLRWLSLDGAASTAAAAEFVLRRVTSAVYSSIDVGLVESEILATIPRASRPTSAQPFDLRPWIILEQHNSSDTPPLSYPFDCHFITFSVRVRDANGDESVPVYLTIQWTGDATEAFPAAIAQRSLATVPAEAAAGSLAMTGEIASEECLEAPLLRLNAAPISGTDYADLVSDGLRAVGLGAPAASAAAHTLRLGQSSRAGTDTNTAGADGILTPGLGTGTAAPALVRIKAATAAGSGTGAHGTQDRVIVGGKNITLTDNSAVAVMTMDCSAGAGMHSLDLAARLYVTDGTDYQPAFVSVTWFVANKAGTVTGTAVATTAYHATSGTLTVTASVTVAGTTATLKLNAHSSLAATIVLTPIQIRTAGPYTVAFA